MTTISAAASLSSNKIWGAVGSMAMCAAMLIASEFMPVSLLTPIAADLHATAGMAGQAISVSGLFAVATSLLVTPLTGRFDRRHVLIGFAVLLLLSLVLIARASDFESLIAARALLGMAVGGFWSLATATIMRLVPEHLIPKALGVLFTGNAVATAFAAPIGSYLGGMNGWRGVFLSLIPIMLANLVWLGFSLPPMPGQESKSVTSVVGLLRRRNVGFGMLAVMLTFAGAFAVFTYLRPFLESYTCVSVTQLSMLLLGLGMAGFVGTYWSSSLVERRLYRLLMSLPLALSVVTMAMLAFRHEFWAVAVAMVVWGAINSAIPVSWSTWLTKGIRDEPESGGGLMVAAIQLSIMVGAEVGGLLLDHISLAAPLLGGTALLVLSAVIVGGGKRVAPRE